MAKERRLIANASVEEMAQMAEMLAADATYYAVEKKFGYHRESVRRWWNAKTDKERKMAALNNTERKKELVQMAFGSTDVALVALDGKIDTALEKAVEELIYRLTSESTKAMSDRDLISATKLLYDMHRDRIKDEETQPAVQNNTQNIINVFSDAIDKQIQLKDE
jgi:hypothetical protein